MTQDEQDKVARGCFTQTDVGRYCVLIFNVGQAGFSKQLKDKFDEAVSLANGTKNAQTSTAIYHLDDDKNLWRLV